MVRICTSFDTPVLRPANATVCSPESSFTVTLAMAARVGGSLTAATVKRKERETLLVPSLTVRVTVVAPKTFVAGLSVATRLEPAPLTTMEVGGRRLRFEESALTVSASSVVSTSKIVNGTARD